MKKGYGIILFLVFTLAVGIGRAEDQLPTIKLPLSDQNYLILGIINAEGKGYWAPGTFPDPQIANYPGTQFKNQIVFEKNSQLYLKLNNSEVRKLSNIKNQDFEPCFSPDGKRIVYCSAPKEINLHSSFNPEYPQLWVMDITTGKKIKLTTHNARKPHWRKNKISFVRSTPAKDAPYPYPKPTQVWVINENGENPRCIYKIPGSDAQISYYPQLTQDAQFIIIDGWRKIRLSDGASSRILPSPPVFGLFFLLTVKGEDLILCELTENGQRIFQLIDLQGKVRRSW